VGRSLEWWVIQAQWPTNRTSPSPPLSAPSPPQGTHTHQRILRPGWPPRAGPTGNYKGRPLSGRRIPTPLEHFSSSPFTALSIRLNETKEKDTSYKNRLFNPNVHFATKVILTGVGTDLICHDAENCCGYNLADQEPLANQEPKLE